jgi:hypothetical protein
MSETRAGFARDAQLLALLESRSPAIFSHGLCPDCVRELPPSLSGNAI